MDPTTDPRASGTKIFTKPLISTLRSMPRMLPTITMAMNMYMMFVDLKKSLTTLVTFAGSSP